MRQCVSDNIANSQELFIQGYRNAIAHLNFIRSCDKWICDIGKISSYYALYQYLVQHYMKDEDRNKQHPYYSQVERYKTYVKDLVKALNVPFGYNIPRFKNLTIEQLFDRNCPIINDDTSNNRMIQSLNN